MKKLVLFVMFVSLIATGSVFAEDNGFDLGVKGGLNLTTLWGSDVEIPTLGSPKIAPKFAVGIFAKKDITDMVSIGADLMYSLKGANYEASVSGFTLKSESTASYLELPIYAAIELVDRFEITAGGYLGYLIKAESKTESPFGSSTTDVTEQAARLDYGLMVGASYEVIDNLTIEGRFSLGLAKGDKDGNVDMKNMAIQILVGYSFL